MWGNTGLCVTCHQKQSSGECLISGLCCQQHATFRRLSKATKRGGGRWTRSKWHAGQAPIADMSQGNQSREGGAAQCARARNKQMLVIKWSDVIFALVCNLPAWRMQKIISQVNSLALHRILLPSRAIDSQRGWGKTQIYIDLSCRHSSLSNPFMSLTSL